MSFNITNGFIHNKYYYILIKYYLKIIIFIYKLKLKSNFNLYMNINLDYEKKYLKYKKKYLISKSGGDLFSFLFKKKTMY